ncbi:hypothetical protein [Salmonella phage vB_SenM-S16]|uniref:Uncharacterized protein n=1 Tax=Salmonella phage S16 TaxID=1087482 RepID=M1HDH8_BPS16|nr:hypothetical protein I133_gp184 [Salmonella phage vB_SenM-S16]AGE48166.1 hypothetical protein [Salmonella phage vB_SenM-S16]
MLIKYLPIQPGSKVTMLHHLTTSVRPGFAGAFLYPRNMINHPS